MEHRRAKAAGITSEVRAEKSEKLFKGLFPGENEDEPQLTSEASADNGSAQLAVRLRSLPRVQPEIHKPIASGTVPICPSTLGGGNSL
jgi:hypothetical protein